MDLWYSFLILVLLPVSQHFLSLGCHNLSSSKNTTPFAFIPSLQQVLDKCPWSRKEGGATESRGGDSSPRTPHHKRLLELLWPSLSVHLSVQPCLGCPSQAEIREE